MKKIIIAVIFLFGCATTEEPGEFIPSGEEVFVPGCEELKERVGVERAEC